MLRVYAFRFVNDWDIAEDVVQDVFVALWNKRTDIEFDGAVKAYLFKAVYNKSLNILSSKKYTEEESVEQFSDHSQNGTHIPATPYNIAEIIVLPIQDTNTLYFPSF